MLITVIRVAQKSTVTGKVNNENARFAITQTWLGLLLPLDFYRCLGI
jgi:hypothetical protein